MDFNFEEEDEEVYEAQEEAPAEANGEEMDIDSLPVAQEDAWAVIRYV
jgi:hypothetical protein